MKATEVLIAERVGRSDKSRAIIFSQGLCCTFRKCHTPLCAHALTDSTPYTPVEEQSGVASLEGCPAARVKWGTRGVALQVAFHAQCFQRWKICAFLRKKKKGGKEKHTIINQIRSRTETQRFNWREDCPLEATDWNDISQNPEVTSLIDNGQTPRDLLSPPVHVSAFCVISGGG